MEFRELWNLPPEIWSYVFSFLSSFDKKNVRLTCSTWYNFCNTVPILSGEGLVILMNSCSSEHIFHTLMKCNRQYMNIKFHGIDFRNHSLPFWEKCGPRIYYLKVTDCRFDEDSFQAMLYFCRNLKYLGISECDFMFGLENFWRKYQFSEVRQEHLVSLCVNNCKFISDYELSILFDVYTNIEELMMHQISNLNFFKRVDARFYGNDMQNRNVLFNSKHILTFSCIFHKIKSNSKILKTLTFSKLSHGGLTDDWFDEIASLPDLRLCELNLVNCSNLSEKAFKKFFSKQIGLKNLLVNDCKNFTSSCLLHLIKTSPGLEYLDVEIAATDNAEMSEIQTLLTTLQLKFLHLTNFPLNCMSKSTKLRYFSLMPVHPDCSMMLPICATHLTHLHLSGHPSADKLTNRVLQTIFEHMINLTYLHLWIGKEVTDYGFTGIIDSTELQGYNRPQFSISRLKLLKFLALFKTCSEPLKITQTTFLHFIFPNLSTLYFGFPVVSTESFGHISNNTPLLECLCLIQMSHSCTALLQMCENWKRLKILMLHPSPDCGECYNIVKSCQHLRFLQLGSGKRFRYYDFYCKGWKTLKSNILGYGYVEVPVRSGVEYYDRM